MKTKKKAPIIRIKGFDGDWEQRKFSDLVLIERGGSPRPINDYITDAPSGLNWVKIGDAPEQGRYITKTAEKIKPEGLSKTRQVQPGDLILSNSMSFGKPYIMGINGCIHDGWLLIRDTQSRFDLKFLCHMLGTDQMLNQYRMFAAGSTVNNLNKELVGSTTVSLPSIEEQRVVGEYLESIDHLITLHQREIDRIVCLRKAMVEKMFPQNGADVPAVRYSRYKEPWRLCQFSEIFTERHIIDTISDEYPQLAFTIEEGVIRPEDKKTNKRDFLIIDKATKKYLQTEYDDIIYNPANVIYGAIHRNALGKGCVSPIYKIFHTDQDSTFMECIVRHPNFIKEISRSMEGTVKKLRTLKPKAFLEMSAYIAPTIEEQRQIGEYFRQMDRLIEIEKEELEKIKHIKSACLEKMFV